MVREHQGEGNKGRHQGPFYYLEAIRSPSLHTVMRGLRDASNFNLGNFELGTGPLNRLGIPPHPWLQGLAVDEESSIDTVRQACGQWHDELSEASLRFCAPQSLCLSAKTMSPA